MEFVWGKEAKWRMTPRILAWAKDWWSWHLQRWGDSGRGRKGDYQKSVWGHVKFYLPIRCLRRGAEQATRSTSLERDVCQMRKHRHLPKTTQLKCGRTQASAQEWMTPKLEFLTSTLYGFPSNPRWTRAWCLRGKDRVELLSLLTHGHDDSHSPCLCYHWVCTASQHVLAFQINHFPDTGPLTFLHAYESSGRKGELLGFFFLSFLLFFFFGNCPGTGNAVLLLVVAATATIRAISKQRTNLLHEWL